MVKTRSPGGPDVALGMLIRLRRRMAGISQDALAVRCGVTFQQIQKYENGVNRISFSRLVQIADALGCSPSDLVRPLDDVLGAGLTDLLSRLHATDALELVDLFSRLPATRRKAVLDFLGGLTAETVTPVSSLS